MRCMDSPSIYYDYCRLVTAVIFERLEHLDQRACCSIFTILDVRFRKK